MRWLKVVESQEQNRIAEKLNQTFLDLVRSMIFQKILARKFWTEDLKFAVHVHNQVTTRGIVHLSASCNTSFSPKPNLSLIRVLGPMVTIKALSLSL